MIWLLVEGIVLGLLPLLTCASWVPRPLTDYTSRVLERSAPGVRRFTHREQHQFDDGTDLELHWEVDANPETILALDLEHPVGARILECRSDWLKLHVSEKLVTSIERWRHVTASDHLHGCGHLQDHHLYHEILHVENVWEHTLPHKSAVVTLATKELTSPSHVFPHCRFFFNFVPASAKDPARVSRKLRPSRALSTVFGDGEPQIQNSFTPVGQSHKSLLNLDVPEQLSNIGYNWDYDANTTRNPQFKYTFPGGIGWVRLYQPYLKAHFSLNINFTSNIKSVNQAPDVQVTSELKGVADFNLDIATAINFKEEKSAGVLQDILKLIDIPGFPDVQKLQETYLNPIKFYLGGTPLTIKPGFSCKLKAYHIGLLKGSLRVGLAAKILMRGLISFDSRVGLKTNVSARAEDVKFTPPNWMLFTQRFEMGVMLEPEFWLKGGFGEVKNMEVGFALRPYFNVSIMQENPASLGGDTSAMAELAIYPFRAVGLPAGRTYAIRVTANSQNKTTANKFSTGVVEFNDNVEDFQFGTISENALIAVPIEVAILENGQEPPIATGQAVCRSVVNGICKPSPVTAQMTVDGKSVYVHLSVVWQDNALNILMSKIKSVALRFPSVSLSSELSQRLSPQAAASLELRVTRNGRTYSVPLSRKQNSTLLLRSRVIYDLGPCFLESWKTTSNSDVDAHAQDLLSPKLDLLMDGTVVGTGAMPPVSWDRTTAVSSSFSNLASNLRKQLTTIPVMVPLYSPTGGTSLVATGEIEIDVLPAQLAAFWVFPYQADVFARGHKYTFHWTLANAQEGKLVNFTLTAMEVGQDGSLTPTNWQRPVALACSVDASVPVKRYDGGVPSCLFAYEIEIPGSLADRWIVVVASWLGGSVLSPHWMVSTPVKFVSGRLLSTDGAWSSQSLGSVDHRGVGAKARQKLNNLASHCTAQPLKYSFGAGMNFVQHMKNILMPTGGFMGGLSSRPDWTSKPIPVLEPLGAGPGGEELSDLLPKFICSGGICKGMMPGCNKTQVNTVSIQKVTAVLSRTIRWKEHIGPKMRHIIAYGLALLPSAIEIGQKQAQAAQAAGAGARRLMGTLAAPNGPVRRKRAASKQAIGTRPTTRENMNGEFPHVAVESSSATEVGHFLALEEGDPREEGEDAGEIDTFDFHIVEPMHYQLSDDLLAALLRQGVFRSIGDGQEETRGSVEIVSLRLVKPSLAKAAGALYENRGRVKAELVQRARATTIASMSLQASAAPSHVRSPLWRQSTRHAWSPAVEVVKAGAERACDAGKAKGEAGSVGTRVRTR